MVLILLSGGTMAGYFVRKSFVGTSSGAISENPPPVEQAAKVNHAAVPEEPAGNAAEKILPAAVVAPASADSNPAPTLVDQHGKPEVSIAEKSEKNEVPSATAIVPKPRKRLAARAPDTAEIIGSGNERSLVGNTDSPEARYSALLWVAILKELNKRVQPWIEPDGESYRINLRVYNESGQIELLRTSDNLSRELRDKLTMAVATCSGTLLGPKDLPKEHGDHFDFEVRMTSDLKNQVTTRSGDGT